MSRTFIGCFFDASTLTTAGASGPLGDDGALDAFQRRLPPAGLGRARGLCSTTQSLRASYHAGAGNFRGDDCGPPTGRLPSSSSRRPRRREVGGDCFIRETKRVPRAPCRAGLASCSRSSFDLFLEFSRRGAMKLEIDICGETRSSFLAIASNISFHLGTDARTASNSQSRFA